MTACELVQEAILHRFLDVRPMPDYMNDKASREILEQNNSKHAAADNTTNNEEMNMVKFYDVSTKREYRGKAGETKTTWSKVGTFKVLPDGKQFLELFMFPNTQFFIFEQKEKDAAPAKPEDIKWNE
jgi:hypothetical protein